MKEIIIPSMFILSNMDGNLSCNLITTFLFLFTGLLFIGISIPLVMEKIKPNQLYGFRTPKTLTDERVWYKANKYMGKDFVIFGFFIILYNLAVLILPKNFLSYLLFPGNIIILIAGTALVLIRSLLYLKKLDKIVNS